MFEKLGMYLLIIIIIIVAIIFYKLEKERNNLNELFSDLEEGLKNRWILVSKIKDIVKNYSVYDENILEKLEKVNEVDFDKMKLEQKIEVNNNITKVIDKMIEIAQNSELMENEDFKKINSNIKEKEKNIEEIIKEYNENTEKYNKDIEKMPNNFVAILFGFNEKNIITNI